MSKEFTFEEVAKVYTSAKLHHSLSNDAWL